MARLNPLDYTIVLIAVLEIEAQAVLHTLDHRHDGEFPLSRGDDYVFHAGDINGRNVVVATFPAGQSYGIGAAASLASQTKCYFRNLWFGLLVGVAAGLPNHSKTPPVDIRLGDVLVALPKGDSAGLISYDLGKTTDDNFELLDGGRALAKTESIVRSAIGAIKIHAPNDDKLFLPFYEAIKDKQHSFEFSEHHSFCDPGQDQDLLYSLGSDGVERLVPRTKRSEDRRTRVWYGPMGSGDKLMKSSIERDRLRDLYDIIGLEMEAAGMMYSLPVGVIRGVCDYGDKHKNKKWQPYAAAIAASYAKSVLIKVGQGDLVSSMNPVIRSDTGCEVLCDLPPQTDRFFGREAQLSSMKKLLQHPGSTRRGAVLCGISGSGKTQLAREYISRERDNFSAMIWINATSRQTIDQAFSQCADRIRLRFPHLFRDINQISPQSLVLEWLRKAGSRNWLVVIDGMDDILTSRSLFQCFDDLSTEVGAICITSTSPNTAKACRFHQISVEHLDIGAAYSLIIWRALGTLGSQNEIVQQWIRKVAKILNRYALGLELAGILIHEGIVRMDMPPTVFESKYKQLTTIDPVVWNWGKPHTLFDIFDTLYRGLLAKSTASGHLLTLCSIYGPHEISISFLKRLIFEQTENSAIAHSPWDELKLLFQDELSLNLAVSKLHEVFLAHRNYSKEHSMLSFSLHGSVCQWRFATIGDQRPQWIVQALQALACYVHREIRHENNGRTKEPKDLNAFRKYLSMTTRCLRLLEEYVQTEQLEAPLGIYAEQYFSICIRLAPLLLSVGEYETAQKLFQNSIEYLETTQEANSEAMIVSMLRGLARCSRKIGNMARTEECLESAAIIAVNLYGDSSTVAMDIYLELKHIRDHMAVELNHRKRALVASTGPKMARQQHSPDMGNFDRLSAHIPEVIWQGPDLSDRSRHHECLMFAIKTSNHRVLRQLLDKGMDVDSTDVTGCTPLHAAARVGSIDMVTSLFHWGGANVNTTTSDKMTPLHSAAAYGHLDVAEFLMDNGAETNSVNNGGWTPLNAASSEGKFEIVRLLVDRDADLTAATLDGVMALHSAAAHGHIEVVKFLLDKGADFCIASNDGLTPLHSAAAYGHVDVAEYLLGKGADLSIPNKKRWTPLNSASHYGHIEVVRLLLARGADPTIANQDGRTPLASAVRKDHAAIVELLLALDTSQPAYVNKTDTDGRTALMWAAKGGNTAIINMLLEKRADPEIRDLDGETCFSFASREDNIGAARILRSWCRSNGLSDISELDGLTWTFMKAHCHLEVALKPNHIIDQNDACKPGAPTKHYI